MAKLLMFVLLLAMAGTTVLGDSQFTFIENLRGEESSSRIVSGWESQPGQHPHQISIRMVSPAGGVSSCGGSIISEEWAMTAAHCTATRVTIVIRTGAVNLTTPYNIFESVNYYNHPWYNEALQSVVQPHDIGLLRLDRRIEFNDLVKPIRVQNSADRNRNYGGDILIASGWGRTWTNGAAPENMNWVYLRGNTNQECRTAFGGSSIVVDSTICASYYNVTSQSTCQGDSGGPLSIIESDGEPTMIGIASFVSSLGCHTGRPAGFIRPGHYHDWYTEVTGLNFDWESFSSESDESSSSEEEA